ncbi:MAG: hypothetical protein ABEK84_07945 [Salinibacter sp.]
MFAQKPFAGERTTTGPLYSVLSSAPADTTQRKQLRVAVRRFKEGRVAEARRRLQSLWKAERDLYVPGLGSVAYWYGRALQEAEGVKSALRV